MAGLSYRRPVTLTLGPSDFPTLRTQQSRRGLSRPYHVCPVCKLTIAPRNGNAHAKACRRRKMQDLALWTLWVCDMHGYDRKATERRLGPKLLAELRERGHLAHWDEQVAS